MLSGRQPTRENEGVLALHLRSYGLAALIALIVAYGTIGLATAQELRSEIGLLTCGLAKLDEPQSEPGAQLRQTRELLCGFRPAGNGPEETYTGTLQGVGPDTEFPDVSVMIWIVKGTRDMAGSPGLLQQVYAAELTANPRQSAPLIGETNISIALQTLADEQASAGAGKGPQGVIAMVVVIALKLKSAPA